MKGKPPSPSSSNSCILLLAIALMICSLPGWVQLCQPLKNSTLSFATIINKTGIVAGQKTNQVNDETRSQEEAGETLNQNNVLSATLLQLATEANTTSPWEVELLKRLSDIVKICGPLCQINTLDAMKQYYASNTTTSTDTPNPFFKELYVPSVNCEAIMTTEQIDAGDTSVPYPILESLKPYYSLDGAIRLQEWKKFTDIYLGATARNPVWTEETVNRFILQSASGRLKGNYGHQISWKIRIALEAHGSIKDSSVLVIGSEFPWVEAICLSLGAKAVTTLEYGKIVSEHPSITTITPPEMREKYLNGTLQPFDIAVSFSSLEHSGLGRYGDALNPWGDLLAVARAWCVVKTGGKMLLGVPIGKDRIEFNAHRVYGRHRWPLVSANWKLINVDQLNSWNFSTDLELPSGYEIQPPLVFEKVDSRSG